MIYEASHARDAKRLVRSLLGEGFDVEVCVLNYGRTLWIGVRGPHREEATYEYGWRGKTEKFAGEPGPDFSAAHALSIAADWGTGRYVPRDTGARRQPTVPIVDSVTGLLEWLHNKKLGHACVYYRGDLAHFRAFAGPRIAYLQKIIDSSIAKRKKPSAATRFEATQLIKTTELLTHVQRLYESHVITLSQRRDPGAQETSYLAVRTSHAMNTLSPSVQSQQLQKQMTIAIRQAFTPIERRGHFKILGITFEGESDKIHSITAKVTIYRDNAQNTMDFRIPYTDLGPAPAAWGPILANKAKQAIKTANQRFGLMKNRMKLEDLPD